MRVRSTYHCAFTALGIFLAVGVSSPMSGQAPVQHDLTAVLEQSIRDTDVVSPISGARVSTSAVRLAFEMLKRGTRDAQERVADSLSRSGARPGIVDSVLVAFTRLWALPTGGHLVDVENSFNAFVNASSPSFLNDPPQEFLALHAILLRVASSRDLPTNR
jgi:hypothetical protein